MFMEGIVSDSHSIFKFLKGLDLDLFSIETTVLSILTIS